LEIDWWPLIPPYLEIEADSRDQVIEVAGLLGISDRSTGLENTIKVYARYGIDLTTIEDLRFPSDACPSSKAARHLPDLSGVNPPDGGLPSQNLARQPTISGVDPSEVEPGG
jgi:hypothetical protein